QHVRVRQHEILQRRLRFLRRRRDGDAVRRRLDAIGCRAEIAHQQRVGARDLVVAAEAGRVAIVGRRRRHDVAGRAAVRGWLDVAKTFRACSASSRLNSHADPCSWLLPDFVTTLTTAPALRPNSAVYECVSILNSWMASGGGRSTNPVLNVSLLVVPSSRKLLDWLRMPLTL